MSYLKLRRTGRAALVLAAIWCAVPVLAGEYIAYSGIEVEPATPTSKDEIVVVVGSPSCKTILRDYEIVISGGLVQTFVEAEGGACGVPPPVTGRYEMPVGLLPAGDYQVDYLLSINGGPDELINTANFSVVDAVVDIPTLGGFGIVGLGLLLCGAAAVTLRRR